MGCAPLRRATALLCSVSTLALGCWMHVTIDYPRDPIPRVDYEPGPPATCRSVSWAVGGANLMPSYTFIMVEGAYASASETQGTMMELDESIAEVILAQGLEPAPDRPADLSLLVVVYSTPGEGLDGWDMALLFAAIPVYAVWFVLEALTFGLIPAWYPLSHEFQVDVEAQVENELRATYGHRFRVARVVGSPWLPAYGLFLGHLKPEGPMTSFYRDAVDDALRRLQSEGLLAECRPETTTSSRSVAE
jgi:hypothetical protein